MKAIKQSDKKMEELKIDSIRARELSDFLEDPDKENLHHEINWEKTKEL